MTPDASSPTEGNTDHGVGRRRLPRHPAGAVRATVIPEPEPGLQFRAVVDISVGGVRLILGRRLSPGTTLGLSLRRPDRDLVCAVQATVIYVIEEPKGCFHTGCAFTRELSDDELRDLL